MIHDVTYLLNVTFLGPGVYKAVSKASLVALFNCFWGAMQTQVLLSKTQVSILGGGMGNGICFQPSCGCFHQCKHVAFAMLSLWE